MCFLETSIGCYEALLLPIPLDTQLEIIPRLPADANEPCTIDVNTFNIDVTRNEIWTLYYNGSKT